MKFAKLLFISLLLAGSYSFAETFTDNSGGERTHTYTSFEDTDGYKFMKDKYADRIFESFSGKYLEGHCSSSLKAACESAFVAQTQRMNQLNTGPAACKAWAEECKDVIDREDVLKIFNVTTFRDDY